MGLVFPSAPGLPRTRVTIATYVQRLDELLTADPAEDAFLDRVHWL